MNTLYKHSSTIIKVVLTAVLIGFLVIVYGQANAKDVPMKTIDHAFRTQTQITRMHRCTSRELMEFMGIDASQYEGFMYYKSKNALGVAEVLVLKAHKGQVLNGAEDAAESRIDSQTHTFESYGPAQVAMLKNAIVLKKGPYLFYCTAKNPDTYEEVFNHVI